MDRSAFVQLTFLLMRFEGFRPRPYLCPAGRWTIGFGTTKYPDGRKVGPNDPEIDRRTALQFMQASADRVDADLAPLLTRQPTSRQHAALLSLAYNVGVGAHDGIKGDLADSTLLAKFNAGDMRGAADEFLRWNKAHVDGRITELKGLTLRRQAERELFLSEGS
jgi:lysozyme